MIEKHFEKITLVELEALASEGIPESRTLDYKETLPTNGDDSKKDFLEDVVSFANASGGDICFGFKEIRDGNGKSTGTVEVVGLQGSVNDDAEKLRLEAMIRDGIKPRVPGIQIRFISGNPKGKLCLVRIPQSWTSPHMVTYKMRPAFFSRNSAGKHPLDIEEIRNAFNFSSTISEKIREFRADRIGKILACEVPVNLGEGPKVVLHIVPLQSFHGKSVFDLKYLEANSGVAIPIRCRGGFNHRLNFDGYFASVSSIKKENQTYLQIYRDGKIEAVASNLIWRNEEGKKAIYYSSVEQEIISSLKTYLGLFEKTAVSPPIIVMLSLLNVRDFYITAGSFDYDDDESHKIDREHLILPDLLVEDISLDADVILLPAFDAIWNACGYDRCKSYDQSGRWKDANRR